MNNLLYNFLFVGIVGFCAAQSSTQDAAVKPVRKLPSDIPTCSQKDSNLNECIKAAFQEMLPRLKDGNKELNIPPLDPFELEKTTVQFTNGIVQGRFTIRNARVYGISEGIMEKVNLQVKGNQLRMEVVSRTPRVRVEGAYKADLRFNDVKMTPKGYFNVSMTDVTMSARPEGELYERDGHTYLRLTKYDAVPDVGDMRIYANGLFPDPALNDVVLEFINQYWRQIYKVLFPETRSTWEPLMINALNEFFAEMPYDLLLTKN